MEQKNEAPESFLTWKKILKSKANANLKAFFNLMLYLFKNPFINKPFPLLINIDSTAGEVKREREGEREEQASWAAGRNSSKFGQAASHKGDIREKAPKGSSRAGAAGNTHF